MTTRDEVLAMAEQAGARPIYNGTNRLPGVHTLDDAAIERFAALAFEAGRKAEREECAKHIDVSYQRTGHEFATAIRERSAK